MKNRNPSLQSTLSDSKALGTLLKGLRKEMALTQEEAAGLCNVGPRFLIELEAGKPTSQIGKIFQVLNGYGLCLSVSRRNLLGIGAPLTGQGPR